MFVCTYIRCARPVHSWIYSSGHSYPPMHTPGPLGAMGATPGGGVLAGREWVRESTPICIRLHNNGGRLYPLGHIRVVVVVVVEKSRRRDPPIRFQCSQIMFSICCRVGLFVCVSLFLLLHSLGTLAALAWPYNLICIQVEWWLRVPMSTGAGLCVSFGPILESRCCLRCGAKH